MSNSPNLKGWRSFITSIPWQGRNDYRQVLVFLETTATNPENDLTQVRNTALEIQEIFKAMAVELDRFCVATCPACRDNCCVRATVWYDFWDLLYLKFSGNEMPKSQLSRSETISGKVCSDLCEQGCRLPRHARPFVCTWYFCPEQKPMAEQAGFPGKLDKIKALRAQMETDFCRLTSGKTECGAKGELSIGF